MAVPVYDTATGNGITTTGTSLSWGHTISSGANRYIVVFLQINNTHSGVSVTYGGNALALLGSVTNGSDRTLYAYGGTTTLTGANTVACSWTTSRTAIGASISFTDAASIRSVFTNSGTTAASSSVTLSDGLTDDMGLQCAVGYRSTDTTIPTVAVSTGTSRFTGTNTFAAAAQRIRVGTRPISDGNVMTVTMSNQTDFNHLGFVIVGAADANFFLMW